MPRRPKQLELAIREKFSHGGRRKGAGRPKTSRFQSHVARASFQARHPLHVTVRIKDGLPDIRGRDLYRAFRKAVLKSRRSDLKVAHFALLRNHFHLIIESDNPRALARGMQSLGVSLAKRVNARLKRKGALLGERYHVHILKTPTEVKRALLYVLGNEYKHQGQKGWIARDEHSSAITVENATWRALFGRNFADTIDSRETSGRAVEKGIRELLTQPGTWLLREGWLRAKA